MNDIAISWHRRLSRAATRLGRPDGGPHHRCRRLRGVHRRRRRGRPAGPGRTAADPPEIDEECAEGCDQEEINEYVWGEGLGEYILEQVFEAPPATPRSGGCRHALTADPAAARRPVRSGRTGGATHATTHPAQGTDTGARRPRRADRHARRAHRPADQRRPQPVEGRRLRDVLHHRLAGHEDRGGVGRRGRRRGARQPRRGVGRRQPRAAFPADACPDDGPGPQRGRLDARARADGNLATATTSAVPALVPAGGHARRPGHRHRQAPSSRSTAFGST